jgi:ankyrin repeat protein
MRGFVSIGAGPNRVGANGARIVPGNSARSSLYRRVSATQSGAQMPPSGPLPPEQINLIRAWIDQGADWPDEISGDRDNVPADPTVVSLRNALRTYLDHPELGFNRVLRDRPRAVNAKGPSGWTPIMYAALYGDGDAVRLLLDKGANPNARNNQGGTALMYAIDNEEKRGCCSTTELIRTSTRVKAEPHFQIATGRRGRIP